MISSLSFLSSPQSQTHFHNKDLQTFHHKSIFSIQGVSEKIQRVLNDVEVKVAMRLVKTIGKFSTSLKDPVEYYKNSHLVYKIPCANCDCVYVGQTKRN